MIIQGIVPPLVTPLLAADQLDLPGLQRLVERMLRAGVDGIFVLGTTGEGPSLSHHLQREVVRNVGRLISGSVARLYVGVTDTSLVEAIELSKFAADQSATAVVAAPPFYFPAGQTELHHWFQLLADQIPLPLLLYNMPSCVRVEIEHQTLQQLLQHENIRGLKDSSGDLNYLTQAVTIARKRSDWPVLVGPEALLIPALQAGAVGGVTGGANLFPDLFVKFYRAGLAKENAEIARLQAIVDKLQQLYRFGKYSSSYLKGLKCALEIKQICSGTLAAPMDSFKQPQRELVAQWLQQFALNGQLCQ
jgi:4-hydroxy-tetrahydrodipicolinate synthase